MNVHVLIDSIVRQTTVLIAQLATAAGVRAPLAHIANQVFVELVKELRQQGLSQKVIADMFGMALRTYLDRVRRLSESSTYAGRSLWEATLEYVQDKGPVLRADVLQRFRHDDPASVRAVLRDLVESGLVFSSGKADHTTYRSATPEELGLGEPDRQREGLVSFVSVGLNRYGPATAPELASAIPMDLASVETALPELVADGRARQLSGSSVRYESARCVIPLDGTAGWEAAVFDHFQAMVTAIGTKLSLGSTTATKSDAVGGSTYGFTVWQGHPHREEALALLATVREQVVRLREKIESYNDEHPSAEASWERVIFYMGQTVRGPEDGGEQT